MYEALSKLDPTKAMGIDNLNPHLLKMCAPMIREPVTCLYNNIMKTHILQQEWTIHKVIPIPKKGDLTLVKNHRKVSLLRKANLRQDH